MTDAIRLGLAVLALAAAPAAWAQEKPVLTVYAYDSFASEWGPGPPLEQGFEAICACDLEFVAVDTSLGALRRVQLEGASTKADILLGLDASTAGEARATGLFAPHGRDLSHLKLATDWQDDIFVPFDQGYFAFVYDADIVTDPPTSFEELIGLPEDFKIVIQDPRSDTPGFGLMLWVKSLYGDRAPEIWAGLKPHVLTMTRGWSEAYSLFLDGEAEMALSYTTSPAYHAISEDDDTFRAALFEAGHYPQIEVAAILASSPNKDLAGRFLDFLTSPEAQANLAVTNWMNPVIELGDALPAAFSAQPQPVTAPLLDEADILANREAWIAEELDALR